MHDHGWARYCPRCGAAGFRSADGRHFECRKCVFDYFHNLAAGVCAVIQVEDRIALIERAREPGRGLLDLPGGFVDPFESLETAVIREVLEELGVVVSGPRYLFSAPNTYPYRGVTYSTVDAVFALETPSIFDVTPNDEVLALRWLRVTEIDLTKLAFESVRYSVRRLLEISR